MDRLQNHISVSSQSNSPSFESSNALISQFSSTNQMLNSLQNLNTTQKNFHQNLASTRNIDFSQFTNQSRQTYHFDTASEAARYTTFHSNYFNGDFRERPVPVNNYSFFSGWDPSGKDGWGKSGHCDSRFQNCSSSFGGGASDCRDSGSSKCESSLFK
jgi:hypothetical protein